MNAPLGRQLQRYPNGAADQYPSYAQPELPEDGLQGEGANRDDNSQQ
jgi:hypothetical protein